MEKKMYTETLEKVRNDYAVRNIDKLEAAIKAGDMEKALELHKLNVEKKTLLKLKKVQSKKIFGSVAAKNAELLGRDTHT